MDKPNPMDLIYSLIGYPDETEWIEFKSSSRDPNRIGQDISALANTAAYLGREHAYKIWGVSDGAHELVGTSFNPYHEKAKGNQDLLIWLSRQLSSNASYDFETIRQGSLSFVVLTIRPAVGQPVCFDRAPYIREGSSTTRLVAGSAKEAELWRRLQSGDFESHVAQKDVPLEGIAQLLDIDAYFGLIGTKSPTSLEAAVVPLNEQGIVLAQDNGRYSITNLGALTIGRTLGTFANLRKRILRIVRYQGNSNYDILDDRSFDKGYALALPEAESHIMSLLSTGEEQDGAFRRNRSRLPQRAIRELLSNTVIHQDLTDSTSGPLVGVYDNRVEFCNPGATLIPVSRVLNAQPKTRNGRLAEVLRHMDLCEEGGTGWDIAVNACERMHIPAPKIESTDETGTKVTLFSDRAYDRMTKAERKNAVYWHACLMYAQRESMGNQSLRERFGLDSSRKNMVAISRLIKECVEDGAIKEEDEGAGAKYRRYIPSWA